MGTGKVMILRFTSQLTCFLHTSSLRHPHPVKWVIYLSHELFPVTCTIKQWTMCNLSQLRSTNRWQWQYYSWNTLYGDQNPNTETYTIQIKLNFQFSLSITATKWNEIVIIHFIHSSTTLFQLRSNAWRD